MPRSKTPFPIASYDPRLIQLLLKAGLTSHTITAKPGSLDHVKGTQLVIRLRRLVRQMVTENHPLAAQVASIQISNWDPKTGTITLHHRDSVLDQFDVGLAPADGTATMEAGSSATPRPEDFDPMAGDKWFEGFLRRNSETAETE